MAEGCQKSKRLSYIAKFKRDVIRCTEEKETGKPLQFLELMKATFDCGGNTTQRSAGVRRERKKFTGPKKGRFPVIDGAVFKFFQEICKTGLFVSYDLLREEAIKKGRSLNIL
jgi:hypothetical protein